MNLVLSFLKCGKQSIQPSNKIDVWISKLLEYRLIDTKEKAEFALNYNIDTLIIVNGITLFCEFREEAKKLIYNAKKIIWIGNDYSIKIPSLLKNNLNGKSIIRIAQYDNFDNIKNHYTLDLNKLLSKNDMPKNIYDISGLFYYGAFREGRLNSFNKYLKFNKNLDIHILSSKNNAENYYKINSKSNIYTNKTNVLDVLPKFQCSIYIEDDFSHKNIMTPANRFYEIISCKTLLFYDYACKKTLENAGYWDEDFAVNSQDEIIEKLKNYNELREKQILKYSEKNFKKELDNDFKKIYFSI